jgi:hypothetical protein
MNELTKYVHEVLQEQLNTNTQTHSNDAKVLQHSNSLNDAQTASLKYLWKMARGRFETKCTELNLEFNTESIHHIEQFIERGCNNDQAQILNNALHCFIIEDMIYSKASLVDIEGTSKEPLRIWRTNTEDGTDIMLLTEQSATTNLSFSKGGTSSSKMRPDEGAAKLKRKSVPGSTSDSTLGGIFTQVVTHTPKKQNVKKVRVENNTKPFGLMGGKQSLKTADTEKVTVKHGAVGHQETSMVTPIVEKRRKRSKQPVQSVLDRWSSINDRISGVNLFNQNQGPLGTVTSSYSIPNQHFEALGEMMVSRISYRTMLVQYLNMMFATIYTLQKHILDVSARKLNYILRYQGKIGCPWKVKRTGLPCGGSSSAGDVVDIWVLFETPMVNEEDNSENNLLAIDPITLKKLVQGGGSINGRKIAHIFCACDRHSKECQSLDPDGEVCTKVESISPTSSMVDILSNCGLPTAMVDIENDMKKNDIKWDEWIWLKQSSNISHVRQTIHINQVSTWRIPSCTLSLKNVSSESWRQLWSIRKIANKEVNTNGNPRSQSLRCTWFKQNVENLAHDTEGMIVRNNIFNIIMGTKPSSHRRSGVGQDAWLYNVEKNKLNLHNVLGPTWICTEITLDTIFSLYSTSFTCMIIASLQLRQESVVSMSKHARDMNEIMLDEESFFSTRLHDLKCKVEFDLAKNPLRAWTLLQQAIPTHIWTTLVRQMDTTNAVTEHDIWVIIAKLLSSTQNDTFPIPIPVRYGWLERMSEKDYAQCPTIRWAYHIAEIRTVVGFIVERVVMANRSIMPTRTSEKKKHSPDRNGQKSRVGQDYTDVFKNSSQDGRDLCRALRMIDALNAYEVPMRFFNPSSVTPPLSKTEHPHRDTTAPTQPTQSSTLSILVEAEVDARRLFDQMTTDDKYFNLSMVLWSIYCIPRELRPWRSASLQLDGVTLNGSHAHPGGDSSSRNSPSSTNEAFNNLEKQTSTNNSLVSTIRKMGKLCHELDTPSSGSQAFTLAHKNPSARPRGRPPKIKN